MIYAFLAYFCWGFFPIYWKFLKHVDLGEIVSYRIIWALLFYHVVILLKEKKWKPYIPQESRSLIILICGSVLLMANWLVYIYAVNSNQIIESSLGYFINPIVNILIGVLFLNEKLSFFQKVATALACIGVTIISLDQDGIPWIALFLAGSFSLYGYTKKLVPISGLYSNQFESLLAVPFAIGYLLWIPRSSWLTADGQTQTFLLLMGAGIITGLPLIFFSEAARRIPYYLMGFFQFLAPTLQFLSGVILFKEPLSSTKTFGFIFIWVAIIFLMSTSWYLQRKKQILKV